MIANRGQSSRSAHKKRYFFWVGVYRLDMNIRLQMSDGTASRRKRNLTALCLKAREQGDWVGEQISWLAVRRHPQLPASCQRDRRLPISRMAPPRRASVSRWPHTTRCRRPEVLVTAQGLSRPRLCHRMLKVDKTGVPELSTHKWLSLWVLMPECIRSRQW
jgi:hypothetical protein